MWNPQQTSPKNLDIVQCPMLRVLIVGDANAGKTTILNKVCNGNTNLDQPTTERGVHDIEKEVHTSAPGFIFHDSPGFQAGGSDELNEVKAFIRRRSEQKELKDQLHVIWYCLPTTSGNTALAQAEMSLFESVTEKIPVVAIFTKMDGLDAKVFNELKQPGLSFSEAKKQLPTAAQAKFDEDYLKPLKKVKQGPAGIPTVQLRNMDTKDINCDDLIKATAQALGLDQDEFKWRLPSVGNSM